MRGVMRNFNEDSVKKKKITCLQIICDACYWCSVEYELNYCYPPLAKVI